MDRSEIFSNVNKLENKKKIEWSDKTFLLFRQFETYLVLGEPYRLVLDSSIIIRFENPNYQNNVDLLAILTFFNFFSAQQEFKASILIRPPVYYELIRRRQLNDEIDYWEECKRITSMVKNVIGLDAFFEEMSPFKVAKSSIQKIQRDERNIRDELSSILSQDWDFDFIRTELGFAGVPLNDESYIAFPTDVARRSVRLKELEIFDEQIASLCLADHILEKLVSNPKNNQEVINRYYKGDNHFLHTVLKFRSNGELEGLGDIDFLSVCNFNKQFQHLDVNNYAPTSIPITVDKKLNKALIAFSEKIIINSYFRVGESREITQMKQEIHERKQLRIKNFEGLSEQFRIHARKFWREIFDHVKLPL